MHKISLVYSCLLGFLFSCGSREPHTGKTISFEKHAVVCARPEAAAIGYEILQKGGNAFDAAAAVHFALAVCYPQAGNVGGGGFMVAYTASGEAVALDFRETAGKAATANMFLDASGVKIPGKSTLGHLSVGVPGSVAGMYEMHQRYGVLPWKEIVQPAVNLAFQGFRLTRLDTMELNQVKDQLDSLNPHNSYLRDVAWLPGIRVRQIDLGYTLEIIRDQGKAGFYTGKVAARIAAEIQSGGGTITVSDLETYMPVWREPLVDSCFGYTIVTMPQPSSGGLALLQMLKLAEAARIQEAPYLSVRSFQLQAESMRIAYANRIRFGGDPEFTVTPVDSLLSVSWVKSQVSQVHTKLLENLASEQTTHFSIVDAAGNAVSVTTTLNSAYGSKVFVDGTGILLNNEMDDFAVAAGVPNQFGLIGREANAVAPGKRMLSSMTPTLVLKDGSVTGVVGTPGGATIIANVFQHLISVLAYKQRISAHQLQARFYFQAEPPVLFVEEDWFPQTKTDSLEALGYTVRKRSPIGRFNALWKYADGWEASADPRGDDWAVGK